MLSNYCTLTQTDLYLTAMDGLVEAHEDFVVVRQPNNPLYRWGNYLLLSRAPAAHEIDGLIARFEEHFACQPASTHICLRWDGPGLDEAAAEHARQRSMAVDGGVSMTASALQSPTDSETEVRRLDMVRDRARITDLNIACDPSEAQGPAEYRMFKEQVRASWWAWHNKGNTQWWGAFRNGEMVGQCGMVLCDNGLGRFQSVETHPDHRRSGVCSSLVTHVGNHAFRAGGCHTVLLAADAEGPALALYRRLGLQVGVMQHGLIRSGESIAVRLEAAGDQAEVHSVVTAAFGRPDEARLIAELRDQPGVISLVATNGGTILGQALFSPVTNAAGSAARTGIALGPIAVRPSQQRRGVGAALVEEGLKRCREAGYCAAFVLGDPAYYSRFGWKSAVEHGLRCAWDDLPAGLFQAQTLHPGGLTDWSGLIEYHPAFGNVT